MSTYASILIVPNTVTMYLGDTIQFQAYGVDSAAALTDITEDVVWSISASPEIAEFSATTNGLLSTKGVGADTVYATLDAVVGTSDLIVHNPLIQELSDVLTDKYRPVAQDYLDLITSQYQTSPKFLAWVRTYLEMVKDVTRLATSLPFYFSFNKVVDESVEQIPGTNVNQLLTTAGSGYDFVALDACVGDQLDIVGEILGLSRKLNFNPTGGVSDILTDDMYRELLKHKVLMNHWDGRLDSVKALWSTLYPDGEIAFIDNMDMTLTVFPLGSFSTLTIDLLVNGYLLPRPQGVLYDYQFGELPYFGFDHDDAYISGFDTGHWAG